MGRMAGKSVRIVVLDGDTELRQEVLVPGLSHFGFHVEGVATARELYDCLKADAADIVVIDIGLPDADGVSVGQAIRCLLPHIGIIMLTGRTELSYQVRALNHAADACLIKPTQLDLLAANVASLTRRLKHKGAASARRWSFDSDWSLISPGGKSAILSRTEQRVVRRLASQLGQLVTREQLVAELAENVHDYDPHRIESLIHRLRRKVAQQCGEPLPLTAVHGKGYVLTDEHQGAI